MKKIKQIINWIMENAYWKHILIWMGMGFSLLSIDVFLRYFSNQYVLAYRFTHASPLFFSISWILLFMGICYLLPKKGRMILYATGTIIFNILVIAQILHMKVLDRFFGLSDFFMAGEGKDYFLFALKKIDWFTIGIVALSLTAMGVTLFLMKKTKEFPKKWPYYASVIGATILLVPTFRFMAINRLGEAVDSKSWEAAYNVKNIYLDFNNQSKNMEVAGLYEQTFRNSYLYIKNIFNVEQDKIGEELDTYFEEKGLTKSEKNNYTGNLKGQNVIFILMESIDSWLINDEVMPTLNKLEQEGLNFTKRYSPTFGGGQTVNSEYAANTGLYAIPNSKAIYNFDTNFYPYSLANMFKNEGYIVESVHANTAKFYNRANFHKALGYTKHYALDDMKELDRSYNYFQDTSLMKNKEVTDLIIKDEPYFTYVTTYSAHLPYSNSENEKCQNSYGLEVEGNEELSCIRNLAHDTDEFLRLLLEELEKRNELDNTTLVLFTDHYMYGYSNLDYMLEYKEVKDTNLIQNVPFIIWSKNLKHKNINTIMDTADIPPTILNLFGMEYTTNYFVGTDVFSENHDKFVYFDNSTFYDGKFYYNDRKKRNDKNKEYVDKTLNTIQEKMDINNKIILGDYFNYLDKKDK